LSTKATGKQRATEKRLTKDRRELGKSVLLRGTSTGSSTHQRKRMQ